jgi:hypothetical protein
MMRNIVGNILIKTCSTKASNSFMLQEPLNTTGAIDLLFTSPAIIFYLLLLFPGSFIPKPPPINWALLRLNIFVVIF